MCSAAQPLQLVVGGHALHAGRIALLPTSHCLQVDRGCNAVPELSTALYVLPLG
jgi:hypothetical protein